jgi:NTE family protein
MTPARALPLLILGLSIALGSCATGSKTRRGEVPGADTAGGPDGTSDPTDLPGAEKIQGSPIVLVLGPGMARGLAHAGVLKALDGAGIRVGAIVGTEIGALIGALYATRSTVNEFEWSLLKLKGEAFARPSGSLGSFLGFGQKRAQIDVLLEGYFGEASIQDARIPVRIGATSGDGGRPFLIERGRLAAALRAAIAEDGFFEPIEWEGYLAASAARTRPFPVDYARELAIGPVVVVDVIPDEKLATEAGDEKYLYRLRHSAAESLPELEQADLVLRPKLDGFGFREFERRNEIVFRGKQAVERNLTELRRLASSTEEDD